MFPVSSISPCVQSIEIGCAEPKESVKLRIQTKISGCASGLSLPDTVRDENKIHPIDEGNAILPRAEEPAALLSTGRNLGRNCSITIFPINPFFLLLKPLRRYFLIFILFKASFSILR